MKKFLSALTDAIVPLLAENQKRFLDRYHRKGRHHLAPGRRTGWQAAAWLKQRNVQWQEIRDQHGIQAAIALGN